MLKKLIEEKIETYFLIKFLKLKLKYEKSLSQIVFHPKLKNTNESIYEFKERYIDEINKLTNSICDEALRILLAKDLFLYSFFKKEFTFNSFEKNFKLLNDDLNIFLSKNIFNLQVYITEVEEEMNPFVNDWAH